MALIFHIKCILKCFYVSAVSLLEIQWEKDKLLVTSNFSFSHCAFYPFRELSAIFIKFLISFHSINLLIIITYRIIFLCLHSKTLDYNNNNFWLYQVSPWMMNNILIFSFSIKAFRRLSLRDIFCVCFTTFLCCFSVLITDLWESLSVWKSLNFAIWERVKIAPFSQNILDHFLLTSQWIQKKYAFQLLPNNKITEVTKLKAFADNKLKAAKMIISLIERVENTIRKGENAGYQHFLLFPLCFKKAFLFRVIKIPSMFVYKIQVNPNYTILKYGIYCDFMDR